MALNRYINRIQIEEQRQPSYGQLFTNEDLNILEWYDLIPHDPNVLKNQRSEIHIYSFYGDYILGDHNAAHIKLDAASNSFLVDIRQTFREANIDRGSYMIAVNLMQEIWGSFDAPSCIVREISADRTELKLSLYDRTKINDLQQFIQTVQGLTQNNVLNNLVINFGFNRINKIVKFKVDQNDSTVFYLKLYQPVLDEIEEKNTAWFGFEVVDPYIDSILLTSPVDLGNTFQIRGPNFKLDTSQWTSNSTTYKNWEEVLDSNLDSRNRVIDTVLSSSGYARLNIDYTSFENFIFYSSAEDRIRNFHYKLSKIEEYSSSISTLSNSTASNTVFISSSIDIHRNRINEITTNFDPYERWLYYQPTASLFTHGQSGSFTPWPKYLYNGAWKNHTISSSLGQTWFNSMVATASAFDLENYNRLYWAIPEHIIMDEGNSNFITFVDLVGQHYDVLYSYIRAMPQIHEKDEHPDFGPSKDILWHIANSYGWKLQNTRQLGDLWNYKLGYNQSGSYDNTGSLFQLTGEDQTYQVWRRTVNNLPYLLKTKGTTRSVKALLSIYGIPSTLLQIKEYGGPPKQNNEVGIEESKFHYALNLSGSNQIIIPRSPIPPESGSWGGVKRVPDTIEFSFKTNYTGSVSQSLFSIYDINSNRFALTIDTVWHSGSYSGSFDYGRLKLISQGQSASVYNSITTFTDYAPIYNNDWWTVRVYTNSVLGTASGSALTTLNLQAGQVKDCVSDVVFLVSSSITPAQYISASITRLTDLWTGRISGGRIIYRPTGSIQFTGQIKGHKEYFTLLSQQTFEDHIRNPSAYHENNPTGSFYTLYRYFPLGLDVQRWDHAVYTNVSSSQPNRLYSVENTASFINFTGGQSLQYEQQREIEYVNTPTLGDYPLYGRKIRLENTKQTRDLNENSVVTVGEHDRSSLDSNRLVIAFSQTDYVNRDVFDQFGRFALDDYIGDPDFEFSNRYPELKQLEHEYFKKYQQRNDINAFIRILAVYDYTFFEQLKQLVPARADLIDGILVEDHVLHRNKVQLSKKPTIDHTQWEQPIEYPLIQSGEYTYIETAVTSSPDINFTYSYLTSSIQDTLKLDFNYIYYSGSIPDLFHITGSSFSHLDTIHQRTGLIGTQSVYPNPYSGSQSQTQSIFEVPRPNCCYKKVIYHYSASGNFPNEYTRQWYTAVSMSYKMYYSRSLECTSYQINECSSENNKRYRGSKLEGTDFNINSPNTIDGGPVITITEVNPNQLKVFENPAKGNLKVE